MIEILIIAFCVTAARRFREAGEPGVSKYIWGAVGSWLGGFVVGGFLSVWMESVAIMYILGIAGYITALRISISAMKAGKGYMDFVAGQKLKEQEKEKQLEQTMNAQLAANVADLTAKLAALDNKNGTIPATANKFQLFTGGGVCDVCNESLSDRKAYMVPNNIFYNSQKYRNYMKNSPLAALMGVPINDAYFARMQSQDKSQGSAVCEKCIYMFE